jgi:hypothetical protein
VKLSLYLKVTLLPLIEDLQFEAQPTSHVTMILTNAASSALRPRKLSAAAAHSTSATTSTATNNDPTFATSIL